VTVQTSASAGGAALAQRRAATMGRRAARLPTLPYLLVLPTALGVATFTLWPFLATLYRSLFRQNQAVRVPEFVGLGNFVELFQYPVFQKVLLNTAIFVLGTVPVSLALALGLALLLNRKLAGLGIFRSAFFYPTILPTVSAATIWLFLYTPNFGLVNQALGSVGIPGQNWLGDARWTLPAIMVMAIWKQTGYFMIFYLAGLQNLSREVFEAAELDGAGRWQQFRYLTIPLLSGTTLFVTTIAAAHAFQMVDQLYIMTQGGPDNASNLLLFAVYESAFRFQDQGEANAMTVVLLAVLLAFTVANVVWSDRRAHYD
jgi:sn-glycerol 3-phosphate transport system permease protein